MLKLKKFIALASLTARESIRQPIFILLTLSCTVLITALPIVLMHKFGEDGKLVRESGLAFLFLFGLLVTGTSAALSLYRETADGTASAVLSKPVDRDMFFLAKFVGIASVSIAFSSTTTITILLSERVSERFWADPVKGGYITDFCTSARMAIAIVLALLAAGWASIKRKSFSSSAFWFLSFFMLIAMIVSGFFDRSGALAKFDWNIDWRIVPAAAMIATALVVFAAIALTISTHLPMAQTVVFCFLIFILGLTSDYLFGQHSKTSSTAMVLHSITPNWQNFWLAEALADGGSIPSVYLLQAFTYASLYTTGILLIGLALFRRSEI